KMTNVGSVADLGNLDVGGEFPWDTFDSVKKTNFPAERAPVFHYAIYEPFEILDANGNVANSGMSRNGYPTGASDFIVAVTGLYDDSQKGAVFTHALGHNVGLDH